MNPFMGLLGLSASLVVFLAGDIGGDLMDPVPDNLTAAAAAEGSKFAIPCRSVEPPAPTVPCLAPGENWSDIS